jgi:hypothetical protein
VNRSVKRNKHMILRGIDKFHRTRPGYLVFGLVELALGITAANLAIPSGDWWEWLIVVIGFFGFLQNFGRMIIGAKK